MPSKPRRRRQPVPPPSDQHQHGSAHFLCEEHGLVNALPAGYPTLIDSGPFPERYVAALDRSGTCMACKETDCITRAPGTFPYCWKCGTKQLYMGKFYEAPCVTGNGRTDGHMSYVKSSGVIKDGIHLSVCAFCGRDWDDLLPEWPELDEEDLEVTEFIERRLMPAATGPLRASHYECHHGVRIVHTPSQVAVSCVQEVSRLKNKALALKLLREQLKRVGRGAYSPEELL